MPGLYFNYRFIPVLNSPRTIRIARHHYGHAQRLGVRRDRVDIGRLYRDRGGICGICHQQVSFDTFTVDHIRPLSKGGAHCAWNLQIAHLGCNSHKRDKLPAHFTY